MYVLPLEIKKMPEKQGKKCSLSVPRAASQTPLLPPHTLTPDYYVS